jgi:hypothetical protein
MRKLLAGSILLGVLVVVLAGSSENESAAFQSAGVAGFSSPDILVASPGLAEAMPDLVITDVWTEDATICYQIMNIGGDVAPGGHYTVLFVDGEAEVRELVDIALRPGDRLTRCPSYNWECTPLEDDVLVSADYWDQVAELDEKNNSREESWKCDSTSPEITSGPTTDGVTQDQALILWQTDEESDSLVRYGKLAGAYDLEERESALVTSHRIALSGLEPSTTYHFLVQSTDLSGNMVESRDIAFETLPLPDGLDPQVSIIDPGTLEETVTISARARDNIGVQKVEFSIDDVVVSTDYSPPYEASLDTRDYANGDHTLTAKVYDLASRSSIDRITAKIANLVDTEAPTIEILAPAAGQKVQGKVKVKAVASDDAGLKKAVFCGGLLGYCKGPFPIGGSGTWFFPPKTKLAPLEVTWNTDGLPNGPFEIAIWVGDWAGRWAVGTRTVNVDNPPPAPPKLVVTNREVQRNKNYFTTTLTVKNIGGQTATSIVIEDYYQLLQAIGYSDSVATYETFFYGWDKAGKVRITSKVDIPKGGTRTYTYDLVPWLTKECASNSFCAPSCPRPSIGGYSESVPGGCEWAGESSLGYQQPDGPHFHEYFKMYQETGPDEYYAAVSEADYVLVTSPSRLYALNPSDIPDVNGLLSDMAELAKLRQGVLGWLETMQPDQLKSLMEPGHSWSTANWAYRLSPAFYNPHEINGNMLIVGETEVVPAWTLQIEPDLCDHCPGTIEDSDHGYADTYGDWKPDIVVGRIIGNTAADLRRAIQTSIRVQEGSPGYGFDRSDAFLVSGTEGGQDEFVNNVNEVAEILQKAGFAAGKLHWKDFSTDAERLQAFINRAPDEDVIFFRDHCNHDAWLPALHTSDFPLRPGQNDFGNTNPFAFACCCLAGNYERGDDDNIAEAFFDSKASVYVGSTEISSRTYNNAAAKNFFDGWDSSETIGETLTYTERGSVCPTWWAGVYHFFDCDRGWRYWTAEYNLYGDPKFGAVSSASPAQAIQEAEPVSSLDVVVPDYEVRTSAGIDYVEIPGGMTLLERDKPQVPYYTASLDYPQGYKVQDVVLTDRHGLVTDTGLNLSIPSTEADCSAGASVLSPAEGEGWYPEIEYGWSVVQNVDGSSTLVIAMYPFSYNPLTTDVRFYKNYSFDIDYTVSPVSITGLSTDKDAYEQGQTVMVDMQLSNSAEPLDVIVSAVVKGYGSGETVDGLLLSTLKNFAGAASFSPQWDSSGFEPGYYYVEATLEDTAGNVLDRRTETFRLGIYSGEVTAFTAAPEYFQIGDDIEIDMTFENTGTVNISGSAVIRILGPTGDVVEEFVHDITDLMPSESISFDDMWHATEAEKGSYNVVGYVSYDSQATEPAVVTLRTVCGDVDCDGDVDAVDALFILQYVVGLRSPSDECPPPEGHLYLPGADVDCDDDVDAVDALFVLQHVVGLRPELCVCPAP